MTDERNVGPTGDFPDGKKIAPDDHGGLAMRVGVDDFNKQVVIEFGVPIKWLGLGIDDAIRLAQLILDKAEFLNSKEISRGKKRDGGEAGKPPELGAA